jgi:hypothetical protein
MVIAGSDSELSGTGIATITAIGGGYGSDSVVIKVVLEVQEVVMVILLQVLAVQELLVKEMMAEVVVQLVQNMEEVAVAVLVL